MNSLAAKVYVEVIRQRHPPLVLHDGHRISIEGHVALFVAGHLGRDVQSRCFFRKFRVEHQLFYSDFRVEYRTGFFFCKIRTAIRDSFAFREIPEKLSETWQKDYNV